MSLADLERCMTFIREFPQYNIITLYCTGTSTVVSHLQRTVCDINECGLWNS